MGRPLGESGLRERDITVLTLHRGTAVIPNPASRHVLEAEDRLLCFGKLEEMRSMIPARPKRRARVKKLPKPRSMTPERATSGAGGRPHGRPSCGFCGVSPQVRQLLA